MVQQQLQELAVRLQVDWAVSSSTGQPSAQGLQAAMTSSSLMLLPVWQQQRQQGMGPAG
jgi:hypothetical protein